MSKENSQNKMQTEKLKFEVTWEISGGNIKRQNMHNFITYGDKREKNR